MESAGYLRTFRNHLILILVITVLGLVTASGVARSIAPTYESSATLFLKVESKGASLYERSQFSLQRIKSYGDLIKSPELLSAVIADLGLDVTPGELSGRLTAVNPANTVLLQVNAEAGSGEEAAALANSAAAQLSASVDRLENTATTDDEATSSITLEQQITAQAPVSPSSPNIPVILGLGLLAGFALGLIVAILLEAIRPRVRTAADVRRISGLPLIAQLPQRLTLQWAFPDRSVPPSLETAMRTAAANLRALGRGTIPPVVTLVPVGRRPLHASTRVALARGIAATGRQVLLVEADLENQRLDRLGIAEDSTGLGAVLAGTSTLAEAVVPVEGGRFAALPAGRAAELPTEYAVEKALPGVLGTILGEYDAAVVQVTASSSPLSVAVLGPQARGAVLVTSFALTSARGLRRELAQLRVLGIVPIGVIMMDVPAWRHRRLVETWRDEDFVTMAALPEPAVVAEPAEAAETAEPAAKPAAAPRPPRRNARTNRARTVKKPPVPTADAPAEDPTPEPLFDELQDETVTEPGAADTTTDTPEDSTADSTADTTADAPADAVR